MCLKCYLKWKILFFREIHWQYVIKDVLITMIIHSFKIYPHFWLVKTTCIKLFTISSCCWSNSERTLSYNWTNDVKSAAHFKLLNCWPRKPGTRLCYFWWAENKQRNGETPLFNGTAKYLEWIIRMKSSADLSSPKKLILTSYTMNSPLVCYSTKINGNEVYLF